MHHVTFAQKKELRDIILSNELDYNDFTFISGDEAREYIGIWNLENSSYQFKIFFKQVHRAGFIFCQINSGSSKYSKTHELDVRHITTYFDRWLKGIKEHISFIEENANFAGTFSNAINDISPQFQVIFKQSLRAESFKLMEICGMGFRKAFEFLVKDYLIFLGKMTLTEAQNEVKLQNCIKLLNESTIIQKLATHIGYLGNDFSHYYRKWDDKEIKDLKEMIYVLVTWIDTNVSYSNSLLLIEKKSKDINETFNKV